MNAPVKTLIGRLVLTTLMLLTVLLTACGDNTATTAPGATTAPSTTSSNAATTAATTTAAGTTGAAASATTAAAAGLTQTTDKDLVIYSARKEELMKPIVEAFQKKTGIKVTLKNGAPGELALLIEQEKSDPRGDVYFTTDVATAETLGQKGLLDSYIPANSEKVPAEFKSAQGYWTGVIGRSRNIMYNTDLVKAEEAPKSVFELTDPKWKGKFAMASIKEGGVRLWLDSLVVLKGEEFTTKFINDLKANGMKVLANHTEVAKAVARGEIALGLLNHYYYVPEKKANQPVGLIYPDQNQDQIGTLVTPLSVSIMKGAKHSGAAKAFVDFALSPEGQLPLTTQENEFPLTAGTSLGAAAADGVKSISEIKRPTLDVTKLAAQEKKVVEIFTPLLSN
jgi:iron(III) transport system substrate-binding protein